MPNVAIVFQGDLPEVDRRGPNVWPALVREIGDATAYNEPPYASWSIMTTDAYNDYVRENLPLYEEWLAEQTMGTDAAILTAIKNARLFGLSLRDLFMKNNINRGINLSNMVDGCIIHQVNRVLFEDYTQLAITNLESIPTNLCSFWTTVEKDFLVANLQAYLDGLEYKGTYTPSSSTTTCSYCSVLGSTEDNFSYAMIPSDKTVKIPAGQQMRVYQEPRVDGNLEVRGELIVKDD
jgi:hypothetical protein